MRFTHVVAYGSCLVFCCHVIFHCVNVPQFIQSNVDENMNTLQVSYYTSAVISFFFLTFFGEHMYAFLLSRIAGLHGIHIFNFNRYCQAVFQSGTTSH